MRQRTAPIDRDSGEALMVHHHRNGLCVAGLPGARHAVSVSDDGRGNLIAMGVTAAVPAPPRPDPFPVATHPRYVPVPS